MRKALMLAAGSMAAAMACGAVAQEPVGRAGRGRPSRGWWR